MRLAVTRSVKRPPTESIVLTAPAHRQRTLADLPMNGKRIKLQVLLRKFLCPLADCPRKVFAQSCHFVCKTYARRLLRAD